MAQTVIKKRSFLFRYLATVLLLVLTGCAAMPVREPVIVNASDCLRKANINEAVSAISITTVPKSLQAKGKLNYKEKGDDGKTHQENLDVQLRFVPSRNLFLQGNSILGEAIRLGSNAEGFYLRFKPKEISRYYRGKWAGAQNCPDQLLLSPEILLEALGQVSIDYSWKFSADEYFDILTKTDAGGRPLKKVYVSPCSYRVRHIEYFGSDGKVILNVGLTDYTKAAATDGISIPSRISIKHFQQSRVTSFIDIKLNGIKPFVPTAAQLKGKLFSPPADDTKGFKHVYELTSNCQFIEYTEE